MRVLKMFVGLGYFCSKDRIVWVIAQCMCSMQVLHMSNMCSMMMMNCFCGMVDRRKAFRTSRDHCQKSSPSRISDTPQAGFEPPQNLSLGFVE